MWGRGGCHWLIDIVINKKKKKVFIIRHFPFCIVLDPSDQIKIKRNDPRESPGRRTNSQESVIALLIASTVIHMWGADTQDRDSLLTWFWPRWISALSSGLGLKGRDRRKSLQSLLAWLRLAPRLRSREQEAPSLCPVLAPGKMMTNHGPSFLGLFSFVSSLFPPALLIPLLLSKVTSSLIKKNATNATLTRWPPKMGQTDITRPPRDALRTLCHLSYSYQKCLNWIWSQGDKLRYISKTIDLYYSKVSMLCQKKKSAAEKMLQF